MNCKSGSRQASLTLLAALAFLVARIAAASPTLTGLGSAPIIDVWSAPSDTTAPNHTDVWAPDGSTFTFTLDSGSLNAISYQRTFNLLNGENGVITDDTQANFRNVSATQYLNSN